MNALTKIFMTLMIITTAIDSSEAKVNFTKKIGGTNGTNFMIPSTRADVLSTESITRIAIQHSRRIEQIEVEYANGQSISQIESVGNDDGDWSYIELEDGEFITYITGRAGTLIDQITFHTSMRRTFGPYGGSGGQDFEISIPSDAKVIGFTGNVGPGINQIGLIYKSPDRVSKITKNKYRGTRYQGTDGHDYAKSSTRTVRDHRVNRAKERTHRDHRVMKSGFTIRDSIGVVRYSIPDKTGTNRPIIKMNERGTIGPVVKRVNTSTKRIVRDHRNRN